MKPLLAVLTLTTAAVITSAFATDVGLSISVGEPGFYGRIDLGSVGRPLLINSQPTVLDRRYRNEEPVYLRVPPGHAKNWKRYCSRYDACARPAYFVRDDWYRDVYAPHYRNEHGNGHGNGGDNRGNDEHRDDHRDNQHDDHHNGH